MNTLAIPRSSREIRIGAAIAAALACVATTVPVRADEAPPSRASRQESVGVASGFAVGAAAGGPIGALVGAAAGGWLGDRMHRESRGHALTREQLAAAQRRGDGLTLNLMFRTEEAAIRPDDAAPIAQFAALATGTPGAIVHVTGFADPRGTPRYNAALAAERARVVAARLVAAGVPAERLVVGSEVAAGTPTEAAAAGAVDPAPAPDLEGYAFQRRVTLRIELPAQAGEATLAQRR